MTTIAALNVRLGMDASNFSQGVNLARSEVARIERIMRDSVPPADKFQKAVESLNKVFNEAGRNTPQYAAAVDHLRQKYGQLSESAKAAKLETERLALAEKQEAEAAKAAATIKDRGRQLTLSLLSSQEKYTRSLSEYNRLLRSGAIDQVTYRRAVDQARQSMEGLHRATVANNTASTQMLGSIRAMIGAYVGFQTITKSVKLATEVEDATVAFEVLTGSVNDAKVLFQQVRDFAAASPITFSNAAQATRTMMSFGIEARAIQQNLRMISDVTGGNNERFKTLTLAFSQMTAAGRLMGQDLLQMINAGFNPLQQISKTTGESMVDLKKRMEDGGISAQEVTQAFADATAEGGMFNGMTERLAETMSGKLNIALSDLEKAGASLGQAIGPLIISLTDGFDQSKSILNDLIWLVEKFSDGAGWALSIIKDMVNAARQMDFGAEWEATNKHLDMVAKRDRDRAREQANQAKLEFEQPAAKAAAAAKATAAEQKAAAEAIKAEAKQREALAKQQAKQAAERLKEIERIKKAADDAFAREVRNATEAAKTYFAEQKRKDAERRDAITKGPSSIEVGSADAARRAAEAYNARIAAMAVPNRKEPTQEQFVAKATELLKSQQEANRKQEALTKAMQQATATMLATRVQRIR